MIFAKTPQRKIQILKLFNRSGKKYIHIGLTKNRSTASAIPNSATIFLKVMMIQRTPYFFHFLLSLRISRLTIKVYMLPESQIAQAIAAMDLLPVKYNHRNEKTCAPIVPHTSAGAYLWNHSLSFG